MYMYATVACGDVCRGIPQFPEAPPKRDSQFRFYLLQLIEILTFVEQRAIIHTMPFRCFASAFTRY